MTDDNQRGKDGKEIALEARDHEAGRLFSPSAARNRDAIRDVFVRTMPSSGFILEVGSGTGEHAVHIAAALPDATWHASDTDPASRASIHAWKDYLAISNLGAVFDLDVMATDWGQAEALTYSGMMSANMIHIAPFAAAQGLIDGAARLLILGGKLFLYGPFLRHGVHTAASNEAFDASLKARDPSWGVRDLEREIVPRAQDSGLTLDQIVDMPANNLAVIFVRN